MIGQVQGSKPVPTEADLRRVEAELAVTFRGDYIEFIRQYNGGKPAENVFDVPPDDMSGIHGIIPLEELPYVHSLFADRTGSHIIPITFDWCGNYVCMDMSGRGEGDMFFLDHEIPGRDALTFLAPSLKAFLDSVRPDDIKVVIKPGQVTSAWIDPDFLREQQRKK
jgi:SMI1-KNR4 cell-wall